MPRLPAFLLPFALLLLLFAPAGCDRAPDARAIVDRAIDAHGGDVLRHSVVEFDFRGRHYRATRDGGRFTYERTFTDSTGRVHDVLANDTLYREVDGRPVPLSAERRRSITSGVNSVLYFALLPFNLNDPAVQARYLGRADVDSVAHDVVEVTFRQEGGGPGYRDRFVYWFDAEHHTIAYLAYTFAEDGGGTRFRKVTRAYTTGGVRFADYANFTADTSGAGLEGYPGLLRTGRATRVSDIVLENVRVRPLGDAR